MADENSTGSVQPTGIMSKFWINGNDGKPSMSATFAAASFVVTTLIYIASAFEKIGPVTIRPFDAAACSSYLIPCLGLYFGRRWTDASSSSTTSQGQ